MKILALDDDPALLRIMEAMLSHNGHDVTCVETPEAAIDHVAKEQFDFVLVDYQMRDKTGVWFMENVKLPRETKALLVTATIDRDVINRMFALGASGYLIKPFDEADLLHQLDYHTK
ncbi:MAG: response regulator [Verrucomicrobia bacterium]|jgi:CheY-like chemotaxis protein|nr:response regulator [Verrucomicrobiota bacterium]